MNDKCINWNLLNLNNIFIKSVKLFIVYLFIFTIYKNFSKILIVIINLLINKTLFRYIISTSMEILKFPCQMNFKILWIIRMMNFKT